MSPALGEGSLNHWTTNEVPSSKLFLNFIYFFWLCWVFIAANRIFSSCGKWELLSSCYTWTSHCGGLSFADLGLWGVEASVTAARGLNDCGAQAQLLRGMWSLPGSGVEPVSPSLAGRILYHCTTREVQTWLQS